MKNQYKILVFLLTFSLITTSIVFGFSEQDNNDTVNSVWDVLWWWVITSTTVGYGDIAPITPWGRIAGVVAVIIGVYTYTNFITIIADYVSKQTERHKLGTAQITFKNHIIICEYTAFADELLQVIKDYPELAKREVVVVSDLVSVNPYRQYNFVRGVPISPAAMAQANIEEAAYVFVFSNARFQEPDLKTLHTISRIQQLNNHAAMFIEMYNPRSEFTKHLKGTITVLNSRDLMESVLQHAAFELSPFFPHKSEYEKPPVTQNTGTDRD